MPSGASPLTSAATSRRAAGAGRVPQAGAEGTLATSKPAAASSSPSLLERWWPWAQLLVIPIASLLLLQYQVAALSALNSDLPRPWLPVLRGLGSAFNLDALSAITDAPTDIRRDFFSFGVLLPYSVMVFGFISLSPIGPSIVVAAFSIATVAVSYVTSLADAVSKQLQHQAKSGGGSYMSGLTQGEARIFQLIAMSSAVIPAVLSLLLVTHVLTLKFVAGVRWRQLWPAFLGTLGADDRRDDAESGNNNTHRMHGSWGGGASEEPPPLSAQSASQRPLRPPHLVRSDLRENINGLFQAIYAFALILVLMTISAAPGMNTSSSSNSQTTGLDELSRFLLQVHDSVRGVAIAGVVIGLTALLVSSDVVLSALPLSPQAVSAVQRLRAWVSDVYSQRVQPLAFLLFSIALQWTAIPALKHALGVIPCKEFACPWGTILNPFASLRTDGSPVCDALGIDFVDPVNSSPDYAGLRFPLCKATVHVPRELMDGRPISRLTAAPYVVCDVSTSGTPYSLLRTSAILSILAQLVFIGGYIVALLWMWNRWARNAASAATRHQSETEADGQPQPSPGPRQRLSMSPLEALTIAPTSVAARSAWLTFLFRHRQVPMLGSLAPYQAHSALTAPAWLLGYRVVIVFVSALIGPLYPTWGHVLACLCHVTLLLVLFARRPFAHDVTQSIAVAVAAVNVCNGFVGISGSASTIRVAFDNQGWNFFGGAVAAINALPLFLIAAAIAKAIVLAALDELLVHRVASEAGGDGTGPPPSAQARAVLAVLRCLPRCMLISSPPPTSTRRPLIASPKADLSSHLEEPLMAPEDTAALDALMAYRDDRSRAPRKANWGANATAAAISQSIVFQRVFLPWTTNAVEAAANMKETADHINGDGSKANCAAASEDGHALVTLPAASCVDDEAAPNSAGRSTTTTRGRLVSRAIAYVATRTTRQSLRDFVAFLAFVCIILLTTPSLAVATHAVTVAASTSLETLPEKFPYAFPVFSSFPFFTTEQSAGVGYSSDSSGARFGSSAATSSSSPSLLVSYGSKSSATTRLFPFIGPLNTAFDHTSLPFSDQMFSGVGTISTPCCFITQHPSEAGGVVERWVVNITTMGTENRTFVLSHARSDAYGNDGSRFRPLCSRPFPEVTAVLPGDSLTWRPAVAPKSGPQWFNLNGRKQLQCALNVATGVPSSPLLFSGCSYEAFNVTETAFRRYW